MTEKRGRSLRKNKEGFSDMLQKNAQDKLGGYSD